MIYWYTGQPGHGKTLHAIERALEFKRAGRIVYACNVRGLDYQKTGFIPMTPEEFQHWPELLPDGAVCLVDEAYEHGMLPKRPPGAKVPEHVERLATHRHRGLDFIFVCQSPDTQCDSFVRDLIERHVHVRRRFGTGFVHLRTFDRYERQPEKATPLTISRGRLPKEIFGLYESTELDTTERKIPWYFWALWIGVPLGLAFFVWVFSNLGDRIGGPDAAPVPSPVAASRENAAPRTERSDGRGGAVATAEDYIASMTPRILGQPWTAPAYDGKLHVPSRPPRIFCMASGQLRDEAWTRLDSCSCITDQGSRYKLDMIQCATIARDGQYEPFLDVTAQGYDSGRGMQQQAAEDQRRAAAAASPTLGVSDDAQQAAYGAMRGS